MELPVIRRLIKGLRANLFGQGVTVVVQLVGVPILLHSWGTRQYGEWLILFAIPAYLSVTDLGFAMSAGNEMTHKIVRGDRLEALAIFQSLWVLVVSIASVGFLVSTWLLFSLPLSHWIHFSAIPINVVPWVLWFFTAEAFVKLGEGVNHAGYRASGDYAFHVSMTYLAVFIQSTAIWITAAVGGGPLVAAAAFFSVRLLVTPILSLILIRRHSWLRFGTALAQRCELQRLVKPALGNLSVPLAQALNLQGLILVIGTILGPLAVVTFSTLRTLTRIALQLVLVVTHAAEPELAAAYGVGQQHLLRSIFINTLRIAFWLALTAAGGLIIFGGEVLKVWTHGRVKMDFALFYWLLISAVASVLWYGGLSALKSTNQHLRASLLYCFGSAATVLLAAIALKLRGNLADAGMVLLVTDSIMAVYTLRAASNLLGMDAAASILQAINPYPIIEMIARRVHSVKTNAS